MPATGMRYIPREEGEALIETIPMWDANLGETQCSVAAGVFNHCTRPKGHLGQHARHNGPGAVAHVWFWEDPE